MSWDGGFAEGLPQCPNEVSTEEVTFYRVNGENGYWLKQTGYACFKESSLGDLGSSRLVISEQGCSYGLKSA